MTTSVPPTLADFRDRLIPYLQAAGVFRRNPHRAPGAGPHRGRTPGSGAYAAELGEASARLRSFKSDDEITVADDARKQLKESAPQVLAAAIEALSPSRTPPPPPTSRQQLRSATSTAWKSLRLAFGPVRIAVSSASASPRRCSSPWRSWQGTLLARLRKLAAELANHESVE